MTYREHSMPIRCEYAETVRTSPDRAFAAIDDLPLTAKWLPPCVSLEKVGSGPNAPGDKLRYVYKQGGKTAEMAGEIVARTPGERLRCMYFDSMFDVSIDLRVAATSEGALTTHVIEITPKCFMAKLMSPLIRIGVGKQTRKAAANLKKLLESAHA
jgi:Polyketide cyclase / dehydrase and lipid transport